MTRELSKELVLKAGTVLVALMVTFPFWFATLIWLMMKVS